jgi:hypothetical protein
LKISKARDLDRSELSKMRCHELRVQKRKPAFDEACDEMGECNFARIALAREHALAEERAAKAHAIKSSDECIVAPAFDRMGMTALVERRVEAEDFGIDPTLFAPRRGRRAGAHDLAEGSVRRDGETVASHGPRKALGHMKPIERDDPAMLRRNPKQHGIVPPFGHREDTLRVSVEQNLGGDPGRAVHKVSRKSKIRPAAP